MYLPLLGEIVLISGVAAGEPGAAVAKVAGAAAAAGAAGIAAASVAAAGSTAYIAAATATATAARALTGYRVLAAGIAAGVTGEIGEGDAAVSKVIVAHIHTSIKNVVKGVLPFTTFYVCLFTFAPIFPQERGRGSHRRSCNAHR